MTIRRFGLSVLGALLFFPALLAQGQVTIVNLSDDSVSVARYNYSPYMSQPSVEAAGWTYIGWYSIAPGETLRVPAGPYYVAKNGRQVAWNNLKQTPGVIRKGSKFNKKLNKNNFADDLRQAVRDGYSEVEYLTMPKGNYRIEGNAYRLVSKDFSFNVESRSVQFITERFSVPGKVVDYGYSAQERGASSISWRVSPGDRSVFLGGSVQGAQAQPFGPREPGYYRGTVTVRYTVPN